jgi:hypothetical protein
VTLYTVDGVSSQGNETVIFVPTIGTLTAPTVIELTGASALNLGYALRGFAPNSEQGTSDDIRLASVQTFENPGRVKKSIDDITYVYDPQAVVPSASNKHYETLKVNVKGYMVDRRGVPATTAVNTGQIVDIYPVQMGDQRRVAIDPSAEGGKFEIIQKPFVIGLVVPDAKVS